MPRPSEQDRAPRQDTTDTKTRKTARFMLQPMPIACDGKSEKKWKPPEERRKSMTLLFVALATLAAVSHASDDYYDILVRLLTRHFFSFLSFCSPK